MGNWLHGMRGKFLKKVFRRQSLRSYMQGVLVPRQNTCRLVKNGLPSNILEKVNPMRLIYPCDYL